MTFPKYQTAPWWPATQFFLEKGVSLITIKSSGSTKSIESFLDRMKKGTPFENLEKYGQLGVDALASATPRASGETAHCWVYKIEHKKGQVSIVWSNTNVVDGAVIAVLIQYGHGTGTGGYVQGRDYINPAIRPIFDKISNDVWEKVKS